MNTSNLILNTDSYKASHWLQYPAGTTNVFSYVESRGGKYPYTVFFGLQSLLKEVLSKPISNQDIDEAARFLEAHGEPFNREGWEYILTQHGGYLPVSIKAVAEGTAVPTHNVLLTIEATDPKVFWLPSYLETMILRAIWYGSTVATQSKVIKDHIAASLELSGDISGLPFKLHDFGARGVSSFESAGLGGAAHLVNFMGTDTITGALFAMKYYNTTTVPGFSIPAAEHSTMTAYGREGEVDAFRGMLRSYAKPGAILAVVSDAYDIFNAVENLWGGVLKQEVIDSGATVVIRPDSGDPATVVLKCAQLLDAKFGSTFNTKGFKVLNHVRIIQGDGINEDSIKEILNTLLTNHFSADNIAFGMGGALLQSINRDTQKFAMKASAIEVNGDWRDIYKDPITDPGKTSKKGRIKLVRTLFSEQYFTVPESEYIKTPSEDALVEVFRDGKILVEYTFEQVRQNSNK